jgi:uncharacterized protein YecE (DUF72 family)
MNQILIGTSGYSYKDWVGPFYPKGTETSDYLSFYSKEFCFVELNFSYYKQPESFMLERMLKKVPTDFHFAIKAHRSITHEMTDSLSHDIKLYKEGIKPLKEANQLAAVLLQFPYSFHYTPQNRKHLDHICAQMDGFPVAVEFRNNEWHKDHVFESFKARGICYVNVDMPDLPKLLAPSALVTAPLAYVRFHGRNKKNWWQGDNVTRYDYLYNDEELCDWTDRIKHILQKAKILLITFNNHSRGQAVMNARKMNELLL